MAKLTSASKFLDVLRGMHLNKAYKKIEGHLSEWLQSRIRTAIDENTLFPLVNAEDTT